MKRSQRLLELAALLSARRSRTLGEIVSHFEVSERTVYRDLADLDGAYVPIVRDEHGYRLVDGAAARPLVLTAEERGLLRLLLSFGAARRHPELARRLATLEAKLDGALGAPCPVAPPLADAGPDTTGDLPPRLFADLERAVASRQAIEIDYASLSGRSRRWRGLDPYAVFHRGGAWYVAGRCHLRSETRSFRLDRIAAVRPLGAGFEVPAAFGLDRYLAGAWTVFRGEGEYTVVLRFDAALAPLVEHARLHPSETVRRLAGGALEVRVVVSHLEEIARWVVGFGGQAQVVAPPELARRCREIATGFLAAARREPPGGAARPSPDRIAPSPARGLTETDSPGG